MLMTPHAPREKETTRSESTSSVAGAHEAVRRGIMSKVAPEEFVAPVAVAQAQPLEVVTGEPLQATAAAPAVLAATFRVSDRSA